ncbi:zinc finger protein 438 [Nerophis lumbriciformis]|uniref:zinc finger protein 438 n=1 Tax=Nerophis lumbriciformis TaxID=546530 RepID=UPI002ADFE866|nr:zinc finger protein 438-like [Nerophis lumbriciformis]XP_061821935.1 zinc finger protein 438-like [Nerophis lumbriciformis]XP_061821936.1 zinc finger protein 438-like [Nerophis lumbriciformis]XP_061821937.1 zinc finger protein 438-like [Nerophis lumbriciformis]
MKSLQFRSIAPKASVLVPSPAASAVLSCQPPPALPEATGGSGPQSIVVPAQNYALMRIAGQDGTFSLVALPPSVSSQTPQQPQHSQSVQKNLKLPIPRYKPVRRAGTTDKVRPPPITARGDTASRLAEASPASGTSSLLKTKKRECKVTPKEEVSEKVLVLDHARSDLSVTAVLPDNAVLYSGSQLEPENAEHPATLIIPSPTTALKVSPGKPQDQSGSMMRMCQSKAPAAQPPKSIAVLSPAIFSKALQIIPSPPKGKLPILPYSKAKTTLIPTAKLNLSQDKDLLNQAGPRSPKDPTSEASSPRAQTKSSLVSGTFQKLPGKKRGRKRKTAEDLAYEARKKRSLSFFRRRVPEKPPLVVSSSKQELEISKKYRTIRPKPVLLMETVPQLVSLPASSLDGQEVELVQTPKATKDLDCPPQQHPVTLQLKGAYHPRVLVAGRTLHRCSTCSCCFQFKHHLQTHMNTHSSTRPYVCPVCRKAYAHSASLSTHMKLQHSEARPRRSLCCEFCEKSFGYVGVYFSHLREVHKVLLTVEPSIRHHEDHAAVEGDNSETSDEDREEPVELQIKCGRCQVVTPTFADMKMHLLYVHGEEVLIRLQEGQPTPGGLEPEKELVKRAAHYWRQLNEKKCNLVKCGSCDEEFFSFAKLKRHIVFQHRGTGGDDGGVKGFRMLAGASAFNCVLCSQVLDCKDQVLEHWRRHHHCEQPGLLWAALSSFCGLEDEDAYEDLDSALSPHEPSPSSL